MFDCDLSLRFYDKTSQRGTPNIALLTFQHFQILLMPRMFSILDFVVEIFSQKAMLNMDWVL